MASNASHMLEAALEQMDDIITGKSFCFIVILSRRLALKPRGLNGNNTFTAGSRKNVVQVLENSKENVLAAEVWLFFFFLKST